MSLFLPTPWFPMSSRCSPAARLCSMSCSDRSCWGFSKNFVSSDVEL